ncbi:MAG: hypothetical protein JJU29_13305 [Verrucomicrobia bacterium]|nr:hypothetical protein [Verrucomicrobiota bacterium]MCH8510063.1 hypothetical protein [Kiritimatiellia bacterium]
MDLAKLLESLIISGLSLAEPKMVRELEPAGQIQDERVAESSGLAHSRQFPGLWWTHNDSGHTPHLFPMDAEGKKLGEPVLIEEARNVDWEDLAADDHGQIWISDLGNNANRRRDLAVYIIDEPRPLPEDEGGGFPESVPVKRKIRVRYPDQEAFPPEKRNFDSEAIFVRGKTLYVLTKHRSDTDTKLYKLEDDGGDEEQVLVHLQTFPDIGMVTAAALHPDDKRLAVLTYTGVWVFETDGDTERFLDGNVWRMITTPVVWRQVEAIDWLDDETLLITNEQRDVYRIGLEQLQ